MLFSCVCKITEYYLFVLQRALSPTPSAYSAGRPPTDTALGGNGNVRVPPNFVHAGFLKKAIRGRVLVGWKGGHSDCSFCCTFLFQKKKKKKIHLNRLLEVTASGSFPKKVNTTHCSGPITILLLHPSGSLQIAKIR